MGTSVKFVNLLKCSYTSCELVYQWAFIMMGSQVCIYVLDLQYNCVANESLCLFVFVTLGNIFLPATALVLNL